MSTVWGTKYRLLLEQLEQLAESLTADHLRGPNAVEKQTVRLLMGVIRLLRQHQVNKRGQCRFCGWTRLAWRLWHRRPRCTVYRALDFAMGQSLDVVWWQLLTSTGREVTLAEVRESLEQWEKSTPEPTTDP